MADSIGHLTPAKRLKTALIPIRNNAGDIVAEASIDEDDFNSISQFKWSLSNGYALTSDRFNDHKTCSMHKMLMRPSCGMVTDHINGNKLDNRRSNLRICTRSQNAKNCTVHVDSKSGIKGVSWSKRSRRWSADIWHDGRHVCLGFFKEIDHAEIAYNSAARIAFGEFHRPSRRN